jgi:UPF0716 family protein affecting phage T7 exclusion
MIPNLTIIVAIYVIVKLLMVCVQLFPRVGKWVGTRVLILIVAMFGISLVAAATEDTIRLGSTNSASARMP